MTTITTVIPYWLTIGFKFADKWIDDGKNTCTVVDYNDKTVKVTVLTETNGYPKEIPIDELINQFDERYLFVCPYCGGLGVNVCTQCLNL